MNRWVVGGLFAILFVLGWIAFNRPEQFSLGRVHVSQVIMLAAAALVTTGAVAGAAYRSRRFGARGPGVVTSLFIWGALIGLVTLLYLGVQFWTSVGAITR